MEDRISLEKLISLKIEINETIQSLNEHDPLNKYFKKLKIIVDQKLTIISLNEQLDVFNFRLATIYYDQFQDYTNADKHISEALKLKPDNFKYLQYKNLILVEKELRNNLNEFSDLHNYLNKLNLHEESVVSYKNAIQIDSNIAMYHFNKANCLNKLKRFDQANECFTNALQLDPLNAHYLYSKEINLIDKDIELEPSKHELYNMKGCFLIKLRDYKNAILQFEIAIKLDTKNADYYYHKGIALSRDFQFVKAREFFKHAMSLDANKLDHLVYKKINLLSYEISLKPDVPELHDKKGVFLCELNDYAMSIDCFNEAIRLDSTKFVYFLHKAISLLKLDKINEAHSFLNKSIELSPDNEKTIRENFFLNK
jgi:tetratricopeptide (TPR) repeat protein